MNLSNKLSVTPKEDKILLRALETSFIVYTSTIIEEIDCGKDDFTIQTRLLAERGGYLESIENIHLIRSNKEIFKKRILKIKHRRIDEEIWSKKESDRILMANQRNEQQMRSAEHAFGHAGMHFATHILISILGF